MENRDIMYVWDNTNFESELGEVINALIEDELEKEDIIGYVLDIAEKEQAIDDDAIYEMEGVLQNRCEDRFDENEYLENKLKKIFDQFRDIKMYYPSGETYTITEEDYNENI